MADTKKDESLRLDLSREMSDRMGIAVGTVRRVSDYFEHKSDMVKGASHGMGNHSDGPQPHPLVKFNGSADDNMSVTPDSAAAKENFENSQPTPENQPRNEKAHQLQAQHVNAMKAGAPGQ